MKNLIISLLLNGLVVYGADQLFDNVSINNFATAVLVAAILAFVNTIIKPIISLLSLPVSIITLGLFTFVIDGLMILLTDYFVDGFTVNGLLTAILFSIVVSIIGTFIGSYKMKLS